MNKLHDRILALASIMQITALIDNLALKGECDADSCEASIASLIKDSTDVNKIYKSYSELSFGIAALKNILNKNIISSKSILIYSFALIALEKKLMRKKKMLATIAIEINKLKETNFDINSHNSVAALAIIYKNTIGKLRPTIIINGKESYLKNQQIADYIRALLFAGIRSVSLWKATGGNMWYLIFNKQKILKQLKKHEYLAYN